MIMNIESKTENQYQIMGMHTLLEITRVQRNFSLHEDQYNIIAKLKSVACLLDSSHAFYMQCHENAT